MSRPGNTCSRCLKKSVSIAMTSSKCPCVGQSLTIRILPSRSRIVAGISPTFSLSRIDTSCLPSRMAWRASRTHVGHSESVLRGQPSGGFVFCHDLSSGLSDHFGIKDGPGLMRLTVLNTDHAPFAATASPFSRYLIGECMRRSYRQISNLQAFLGCLGTMRPELAYGAPGWRPTGRPKGRHYV